MVQAMRRVLLALSLVLPVFLSGCAARATFRLVEADQHVQAAIKAGSGTRAPYETTLARAYLEKAREEAGRSDFGAAEQLARRAIELSDAALARAASAVRVTDLPTNAADIVPEERAPSATPAPAPTLDLDLDAP
jgi:hypothetical protein